MEVMDLIAQIEKFKDGSLTRQIAALEKQLVNVSSSEIEATVGQYHIDSRLLEAALAVKRLNAQIDVVVHTVGILHTLPFIMAEDELVVSLSLGAGNAGSEFDLVTTHQIAEFKFIHWKPKGNAVRNKTLFQDFYKLACEKTDKKKNIYLLQTDRPLRFLAGRRNILKVLDRNRRVADHFARCFGDQFMTVGEFYAAFKEEVHLHDLSQIVPTLARVLETSR
jgi:hypothetical protein